MNHATYNLFKYEKKIKHLERKKKRNDKQKALLLFGMMKTVNQLINNLN